jgi:hypothetical protein
MDGDFINLTKVIEALTGTVNPNHLFAVYFHKTPKFRVYFQLCALYILAWFFSMITYSMITTRHFRVAHPIPQRAL